MAQMTSTRGGAFGDMVRHFLVPVRDKLLKAAFTVSTRMQFYEELGVLLDNGKTILDSMIEIYETEANAKYVKGQPPAKSIPMVVVAHDCISAINAGRKLSDALAYWVTPLETSLVMAGERTGSYLRAFERALLALEKQAEMSAGVRKALAYPGALFAGAVTMYLFIAYGMAPALLQLQPADKWDGDVRTMLDTSLFIQHNIGYLVAGFALFVGAILYSLPRMRGRLRDRMDKISPWSVYRLFYGAVFLLNVGVMLRCGIALEEALVLLNARANPYLRERITNTLRGIRSGLSFGDALFFCEHEFPSRKAVNFIRKISDKQGFDKALEKYTLTNLNRTIKQIHAAAAGLRIAGLVAAAYAAYTAAVGVLGISSSVSSFTH